MLIKDFFPESLKINTQILNFKSIDLNQELLLSTEKEDFYKINNNNIQRKREFIASRICARQALATLGVSNFPLRKNPNGPIIWPENIIGSISHTKEWCIAAVALRKDFFGIGIDIEDVSRINTKIAKRIMNEVEGRASARPLIALYFSAKESVFKLIFSITKHRLFFKDINIKLINNNSFSVEINNNINFNNLPVNISKYLQGYFIFKEGLIITTVILYINN